MPSQPELASVAPSGSRSGGAASRIRPLTAAGALLMAIAATGLLTYTLLTLPARLAAASGPPEAFRQAATQQAALTQEPAASGDGAADSRRDDAGEAAAPGGAATATPPPGPTPTLRVAVPSTTDTPTPAPAPESAGVPDWVEEDYWLSIPRIGLEAPVMGFSPRARDVDGIPVNRLPVPNTFAVGWDQTSAEPGFAGNTVLAGHNNLFGAVFADLTALEPGDEISVWSEYGVFAYRVQQKLLLEEEGQPLEVRLQNAQWLNDTPDDRLTLITCWPRESYTHRLIIVATR